MLVDWLFVGWIKIIDSQNLSLFSHRSTQLTQFRGSLGDKCCTLLGQNLEGFPPGPAGNRAVSSIGMVRAKPPAGRVR
jgi:hypothetical protein